MDRKIRFGMVGGGIGGLIGDVHRKAATFDGCAELVCGCFSQNYERTLAAGRALFVSEERIYHDYKEMAEKESKREDRIDFVSIVTPNKSHYEIAKMFLEYGFNIVMDKPLCFDYEEGLELERIAKGKGLLTCITYTNSGYPMVKHAKEMIKNGDIGKIYVVMAEYAQEWLIRPIERNTVTDSDGVQSNKQAIWRTDPKQSGKSNCVADIGTHIENTVSYMTGLKIESVCASLDKFVEERLLDDNAEIMLRYNGGAKGIYWCSQVAMGQSNGGLKVRVFGENGSIEWAQENGDDLKVSIFGQPVKILSRNRDEMNPLAADACRLPNGLREGYYEAFSNIYASFLKALAAKIDGKDLNADYQDFSAGLEGIRFVDICVESSEKGSTWINY